MSTYVLVHGAFLGGWCWRRVAEQMQLRGHTVVTPTLTGCGDRFHLLNREVGLETHALDIEQTLVHEDLNDVILVGHSYGGTAMTVAAARVPSRVRKMIYLDAQAPVHGQTASGAMGDGTAGKLAELAQGDDGWLLDPLPLDVVGVVKPGDVAWVAPRRHPHPLRTLLEPVTVPEGSLDAVAKVYIVCQQRDKLITMFGADPLAPFVERARREHWPVTELDAPHDAMIAAPELTHEALLSHG